MREKRRSVPPVHASTRAQTLNLGMCSDRELNAQTFGVWDDAPTNQATQAGKDVLTIFSKENNITTQQKWNN